tara:strand:- start:1442 stop:2140 length:699 start_codon:yes stop_codon:yes gene_type:complete
MIIYILFIIIGYLVYKLYFSKKEKCKVDSSMEMDVYPSDDKGYIKHMIQHHQVAVDMSEHLLKYTKDPRMIVLCRDIIWLQKNEIWQMKNMLESKPYVSPLTKPRTKIYEEEPILQKYYPERSSYNEEQKNNHDNYSMNNNNKIKNNNTHEHFKSPVVDRSMFFPDGDKPQEHIDNFVADGYYPNNPPLDDPRRNSNLQVRSEMPNLTTLPSHWNETTIKPDTYRRPLEIDN